MPSALSLLERNPPTPADLARMINGYRIDQRPPPEPLIGPDVPTHDPDVLLMDHGWREEQPGYQAYASAAIKDLAPTPLDAAAYVPGLSDAADAALTYKAMREGRRKEAVLYGSALALPFVSAPLIHRGLAALERRMGPVGDVPISYDRVADALTEMEARRALGDAMQAAIITDVPAPSWNKQAVSVPVGVNPTKSELRQLARESSDSTLRYAEPRNPSGEHLFWPYDQMLHKEAIEALDKRLDEYFNNQAIVEVP